MAGRSRGDNSRRTTQVGIWSFGIFRTVILSGSVLPLGIGGFLIAQQQSGVYLRLIVAAAVVPVATVVIRICLFPVVVVMQSNSYEPVRCAFFGLFPWRRGPAILLSVSAATNTWVQFTTDAYVLRSVLLTLDSGPKAWGLGSSKSEERVRLLCAQSKRGRSFDLRAL